MTERESRDEREPGDERDERDERRPGDPRDERDVRDSRELGHAEGAQELRWRRFLALGVVLLAVTVSIVSGTLAALALNKANSLAVDANRDAEASLVNQFVQCADSRVREAIRINTDTLLDLVTPLLRNGSNLPPSFVNAPPRLRRAHSYVLPLNCVAAYTEGHALFVARRDAN